MPDETLSILQPYAFEPAVHALLDACVGRLARRDGDSFRIDEMALRHIADWLRAALANDEPWLKNLDGQGRPKKLLKFGSVDAIVREADKAMLKAAQRLKGVTLVDGDEELVEVLDDGYYVVRLLTPAALDRESAEMQHCIGNGGYDEYLGLSEHEFLSLRDQSGKPHITIEVSGGWITELLGKQNRFPIEKYSKVIIPFLMRQKWQTTLTASSLGYVVDVQGSWYSIFDLPDNLEIDGNLYLAGTKITKLPKNLKVSGNLSCSRTRIRHLPSGMQIGRMLYVAGMTLTSLPDDIKVGGGIDIMRTDIKSLPESIGDETVIYGTKHQPMSAADFRSLNL